jgi:hypothetical protein
MDINFTTRANLLFDLVHRICILNLCIILIIKFLLKYFKIIHFVKDE